jgi:hypothetical protein
MKKNTRLYSKTIYCFCNLKIFGLQGRNKMKTVQGTNLDLQPVLPTTTSHESIGNISFDRRADDSTYATYVKKSYRAKTPDGTRTTVYNHKEYLGRVLNEREKIFFSHKRGVFKFTVENGYEPVEHPEDYALTLPNEANVRFGTTFVFDEYLKQYGLNHVLNLLPLDPSEMDTLYSLLAFKTFAKELPYDKLDLWWTGDYSSILYPKAITYSQSITLFLSKIGNENNYRIFFSEYLKIAKLRLLSDLGG